MQCKAKETQFGYSTRKGWAVLVPKAGNPLRSKLHVELTLKPLKQQQSRSKQGASNAAMRPILLFPEDSRPMGHLSPCQACIHPHRARNASCRMIVNRL